MLVGETTMLMFAVCRQVLTSLLNMPERFDWKECAQSEEEDREDAQQFKTAFAPFDPCL